MLHAFADEIRNFLLTLPEVHTCRIYGSLSTAMCDAYSDIDLEIDVSGIDNGVFLTTLPEIFAQRYPVVLADFAPSLAPEKYIVTLATDCENPFTMIDITAFAEPHCTTVSRAMLSSLNNPYSHTLKLFSANLKHFIRKQDCLRDIRKMHNRILGNSDSEDCRAMLRETYRWLIENVDDASKRYVLRYEKVLAEHGYL